MPSSTDLGRRRGQGSEGGKILSTPLISIQVSKTFPAIYHKYIIRCLRQKSRGANYPFKLKRRKIGWNFREAMGRQALPNPVSKH